MSGRTLTRKPKIVISTTDHDRLATLAVGAARKFPAVAETLQAELARAKLVEGDALPDDAIRMGSVVTYRVDDEPARTVTLVYPAEADIDARRISILTPIGAALLGLSPGQTMPWTTNAGDVKRLLIVAVDNEAAG